MKNYKKIFLAVVLVFSFMFMLTGCGKEERIEGKVIDLIDESANSSVAHSVILLRAKKGADIEKLKKQIKESINPRKWICVGVEDEDVIIKNRGDLVIAIVVEDKENREIIEKGFDNLKES